MRPISSDLRRRIIEAIRNNEESPPEIAGRFEVSLSFVEKLWHLAVLIKAPVTIDGAVEESVFLASVEQVSAPTLSAGDGVASDNLGAHRVRGARNH